MIKKPFFSIVMPTYNRAEDLQFALFCIFRQTFTNFEVVVVDNCSTDQTRTVVNKFKNKKIRYFKNKENIEMILNQKKAIEYAKGEYVFTHSDDDFLLYRTTLEEVYKKITKYDLGYVRINYVSLSINKKQIFDYKVHKSFKKDAYFKPHQDNKKLISFIVETDPYFITGIIFKNDMPRNIKIINADPNPWIEILFYVVKNFGAYFIKKPQIVAYWSRRKIHKNQEHHFYRLVDGKLKAENYFNAVKKKLSKEDYAEFLHKEIALIYLGLLPAIKLYAGNKTMLQICSRISRLDKYMKRNLTYWIKISILIVFPRIFLEGVRDMYLRFYTKSAKAFNEEKLLHQIHELQMQYMKQFAI